MLKMVKGYKATDANMKCRGYQFELGKVHEHEGEIKICESGFHFCLHPSGVWSFYRQTGTRVFEVEAYEAADVRDGFGAEVKMVAKKIKLVRELLIGGRQNTGDWNTGNQNTGHWNTGNQNTGDRNTGHQNTGNQNTGNWNITNNCSGFFCQNEQKIISFDVRTKLSREEYLQKYPEVYALGEKLYNGEEINFDDFRKIPGITAKKINSLQSKLKKSKAMELSIRK